MYHLFEVYHVRKRYSSKSDRKSLNDIIVTIRNCLVGQNWTRKFLFNAFKKPSPLTQIKNTQTHKRNCQPLMSLCNDCIFEKR